MGGAGGGWGPYADATGVQAPGGGGKEPLAGWVTVGSDQVEGQPSGAACGRGCSQWAVWRTGVQMDTEAVAREEGPGLRELGCMQAPVQRHGEVQEGGDQLGRVALGQHREGLQAGVLGLGHTDRAELQVDGLAQAGHLRTERV